MPAARQSGVDGAGLEDLFGAGRFADWVQPSVDEERVAAHGICKYAGNHLTLYTDLRDETAMTELLKAFDQAVPQWCRYFEVPEQRAAEWHMVGCVMLDKERFQRAGLLPDDLPQFLNGYQRNAGLWVYEQPSAYYRRHLLLHEGTHGFMNWALGGCGPPWYMEGVAELLATHRWRNGELTLGYFPTNREETPEWGRIKIIKDDLAAAKGKTLRQVMHYDATAHLRVEPYAWCWAAATFFDQHPLTQASFRNMRKKTQDRSLRFSEQFYASVESEWHRLMREWQLFVFHIEYGYSLERERLHPKPVQSLPAEGVVIRVAADRGWQSTGYRLERDQKYRFEATGRYQVANQPKIWWCAPNGVTMRYYNRMPLGVLLGAIVDEEQPPDATSSLLTPSVIGLELETTADRGGTLYLRINDSPAELSDNAGEITVRLTPSG